MEPVKKQFFEKLMKSLPSTANPRIESSDLQNWDIYWDNLFIGLTDKNTVSVSDFSSGKQQYMYFENLSDQAIDHITNCYKNNFY